MSQHEPGTNHVADTPVPPTVAGKRRGQPKRSHRIATIALGVALTLALVLGVSGALFYRHLNSNLDTQDFFADVDNRPEDFDTGPDKPIRILVLGLDTREGEGNDVDGETGADGSDTTILLHISADRSRAYGISIPRDSLVDRPDCGPDNEIPGATGAMWNTAFSRGGAPCTIEQFEQNTGVRLDDSVVVDFNGFKGMVDAVGGVPMCIPYDIHDPMTNYTIAEGERELDGEDALAYVRLRYIGSGSDIDRITRQQAFMASLVNKVVSRGTLARPDRVVRFLNAATKSLKPSEGLGDISKLAGLALSLNSVGLDQVQFLTVPNGPAASDPNRVEWADSAQDLWDRVARDEPLSEEFTDGAIKADQEQIRKGKVASSDNSPSAEPTQDVEEDEDEDGPTEEEIARAHSMGMCA